MKLVNIITKTQKYKEEFKNVNSKAAAYFMLLAILFSIIVAILPSLFKGDTINNLNYVVGHEYITIAGMFLMAMIIYALMDGFLDSNDQKDQSKEQSKKFEEQSKEQSKKFEDQSKEQSKKFEEQSKKMGEHLTLVESMIETKGLETIVTSDKITDVENNSDEIIMILDNLFLDLPVEYRKSFEDTSDDFGTFFKPVHENIKKGKQYTYYLKYDNNTHNAINLHMKAHYYTLQNEVKNIKEPIFILIPSSEFSFFSDIYIYKNSNDKSKSAYEWLPTLTKNKTLFYLQFDINQTNKLEHILITTKKKYGITLGTNLQKNEEFIVTASYINQIEKESTKIQIITDDLSYDLKEGIFFDAIEENIQKDTKYTYYVPDTKKIRQMIDQYIIDHKLKNNQNVIFRCIPDNIFFFFNDVYIYDSSRAFEYIPATNMYFIYNSKQLEKLLFNIKSIEISLNKDSND